jgi:lantibiotic modifying enzyme
MIDRGWFHCWLLLLATCVPGVAAAQLATPRTTYLDAAEAIGQWLLDVTAGGTRFPIALTIPGAQPQGGFGVGLEGGAAGVGLFALQLHRATRDPRHLELAIAAAQYERGFQIQDSFGGPDYLTGAAGSGLFLLGLHATTGDPKYLDWAEDAADYHHRTAVVPADGERFWEHSPNFPRHYTGIPHGAAGIALFHLALHHYTGGKPRYLEMAEDAYRWIRNHSLALDTHGSIGFKRLTDDGDVYNWWSGGSAGILQVQVQLYAATGDPYYLDELRRTANGLVALAETAPQGGLYWTTGRPSGPAPFRPIVFSHGNASIAPALLLANELVADQRYADTARGSVDWLAAVARSDAGSAGVWWEHSPATTAPQLNGALYGTGSVAWTFSRMTRLLDDPRLRVLAIGGADHLLAVGESPVPGQLRWRTYQGPPQADWTLQYRLGWYNGNAGIGMFLLAVHALVTDETVSLDVH